MRLFDLLPKFVKKILVRRDYRMVKAELALIQNQWIPKTRFKVENYQDKFDLRSKEFYEANLQHYLDLELFLKEDLEELSIQMKALGLELE